MNKIIMFLSAAFISLAVHAGKPDLTYCSQFSRGVKYLLKDHAAYGKQSGNRIELLNKENQVIGYMLINTDHKNRLKGYNDFINTAVILNRKLRIIGIALGKHRETPGYMRRVARSKFPFQWNDLTAAEALKHPVQIVTRATYSSNAIAREVQNACRIYTAGEKKSE